MKFTKLDLQDELNGILKKKETEIEKAKGISSGHRMVVKLAAEAYKECEKEIDRQVAIYNKEEGQYEDSVEDKVSIADDVVKGMERIVDELEDQWDETKFKSLSVSLDQISKFQELIDADANGLVAHQAFRGNSAFKDENLAKEVLGDKFKTLNKKYMTGRAAKIEVVASMKGQRQKLSQFIEQGKDHVKTATALKNQTARSQLDSRKATRVLEQAIKDILKDRGDLVQDMDKLVERMVKFNGARDPHGDPATMQEAELNSKVIDVALKKHAPALKTADSKLKNLEKVMKPYSPVQDIQDGLQKLKKEVGAMKTYFKGFMATRDQFLKKLAAEQQKM